MEDSAEFRQGCRTGVRAAIESMLHELSGPSLVAMQHWLAELDKWTSGPIPAAPHLWADGLEPPDTQI